MLRRRANPSGLPPKRRPVGRRELNLQKAKAKRSWGGRTFASLRPIEGAARALIERFVQNEPHLRERRAHRGDRQLLDRRAGLKDARRRIGSLIFLFPVQRAAIANTRGSFTSARAAEMFDSAPEC
jgi:hypothetical protein